MLDQRLAEAIQRILAREGDRFPVTGTLQRLVDDFAFGSRRGKSVYFSDKDREEMRLLLEAKGYALTPIDLAGGLRHEVLAYSPNEKAGGQAVKRNRISIKSMDGEPLLIDERSLLLPNESHLDIDWTRIVTKVGHRCILVVENYESFDLIHKTSFDLPDGLESPLIVYHGDPHESRLDGWPSGKQSVARKPRIKRSVNSPLCDLSREFNQCSLFGHSSHRGLIGETSAVWR
jgi:hypothetical protein